MAAMHIYLDPQLGFIGFVPRDGVDHILGHLFMGTGDIMPAANPLGDHEPKTQVQIE